MDPPPAKLSPAATDRSIDPSAARDPFNSIVRGFQSPIGHRRLSRRRPGRLRSIHERSIIAGEKQAKFYREIRENRSGWFATRQQKRGEKSCFSNLIRPRHSVALNFGGAVATACDLALLSAGLPAKPPCFDGACWELAAAMRRPSCLASPASSACMPAFPLQLLRHAGGDTVPHSKAAPTTSHSFISPLTSACLQDASGRRLFCSVLSPALATSLGCLPP